MNSFSPFYSCGCGNFIVLQNRYLTEFVNARKIKIEMKTVCVRFTQNVLHNWLIGHTFANIYRLWISQMQTAQKKRVHILYHDAYQSMARFPALELLTNFDFTHSTIQFNTVNVNVCIFNLLLFLYCIRSIHYQSKMRAQLLN